MRWLKGSMRLRSRFLFLSKLALLEHGVDFGQSRQQWFKMLTFFLAQMKVVALETRF